MTVATEQSSEVYTSIVDGVALNVPFPVQATTELKVRYGSSDTLATLGTHYTVALVPPEYLTATVTPVTGFAALSGGTVSVRREVPYTQPTDIPTLASLASARLEQMFDRIVFITQQLRDALTSTLRFPTTDTAANIAALPPAADRASKYLAFGPDGKPIAVDVAVGETPVTSYGAAVLALTGEAGAQTLFDVYSTADVDVLVAGAEAAAVPKSLIDAAGDLIYGSAADTVARLALGTSGQVLGRVTGAPAWITPTVKLTVFTASGDWTVDVNMRQAFLFALGGGGAGGGSGTATVSSLGAGGGGAGSWSLALTDKATAGTTQVVTIGAAGAAGAAGDNPGGAGSDTSIGALCVGKGGAGGLSTGANYVGTGGVGGVVGTGDVRATGMRGISGVGMAAASDVVATGGNGGSSILGGGGLGPAQNTGGVSSAGGAATGYGAGGGGASNSADNSNSRAGGAGTAGLAFVVEIVRP